MPPIHKMDGKSPLLPDDYHEQLKLDLRDLDMIVNATDTQDAPPLEKGKPAWATLQVGGMHYKSLTIQPAEFSIANGLGFCEGNVVKYVTRWKAKGGVQDLRKARHYLDMLIEHAGENPFA